jgi:hypothetical protein
MSGAMQEIASHVSLDGAEQSIPPGKERFHGTPYALARSMVTLYF